MTKCGVKWVPYLCILTMVYVIGYMYGYSSVILNFDDNMDSTPLMVNDKYIPRIIHQIWLGNKLPKPIKYMDTFRIDYIKLYPLYKYMDWNDSLIDDLFQYYIKRSNRFNEFNDINFTMLYEIYSHDRNLPSKSDIARLVILYKYGGIYVDADSVYLMDNKRNFDDIIHHLKGGTYGFTAREPPRNKSKLLKGQKINECLYTNGVIGFPKNSQLVKKMLIHLIDVHKQFDYFRLKTKNKIKIWQLTGPDLLLIIDEYLTILPSIYFYPIRWDSINDPNIHLKMNFSNVTYMFQYGISTSKLRNYN